VGLDAEHRPLVGRRRRRHFAISDRPVARENSDIAKRSFAPRSFGSGARRNPAPHRAFAPRLQIKEDTMGKGLLLWLVGVPIPVIILLWLFFGR
jgi:hypothetical protein